MTETAEILITVKGYPNLSNKYNESNCVAGIRLDTSLHTWIRLYPVPFRYLEREKRFKKYSVVRLKVTKSESDRRPETYKPDLDSLEVVSKPLSPKNGWRARRDIVDPLIQGSLCELLRRQEEEVEPPSLGGIRPRVVTDFTWEKLGEAELAEKESRRSGQQSLLSEPKPELEIIPYRFRYHFTCESPDCPGHRLTCVDWEVGQAYRNFRGKYGDEALEKMRDKFLGEMCAPDKDVAFFVGNQYRNHSAFLVLGVYWPPRSG